MNKPYMIAEIGVNYYDTARQLGITPLEAAKLYIDKVAEAGIDCAKFQTYKADTIVSKNSPAYWDTTKEPTKTQYELFLKFDHFGKDEYLELGRYAHQKGFTLLQHLLTMRLLTILMRLLTFIRSAPRILQIIRSSVIFQPRESLLCFQWGRRICLRWKRLFVL